MLSRYSYKLVASLLLLSTAICFALIWTIYIETDKSRAIAANIEKEVYRLKLSVQLKNLSLELDSLDKQRSQYIFSLSQKKITDEYQHILFTLKEKSSFDDSLLYIKGVQYIIDELKRFREDMKRRNDLLFQKKNLQIILNNNIDLDKDKPVIQNAWKLLKDALDSTNLIALGELNRRYNQELVYLPPTDEARRGKLLLTAKGPNGSLSTAENIIRLNTQLGRYVYNIKKESEHLTSTLLQEISSLQATKLTDSSRFSGLSIYFFALILLLILLITGAAFTLFIKYRSFASASNNSLALISRFHNYETKNPANPFSNLFDYQSDYYPSYMDFISDTLYQFFLRTADIVVIVDRNNTPIINSNVFYDIEKSLDAYSSNDHKDSHHVNYQLSEQSFVISHSHSYETKSGGNKSISLPIKFIHTVGDSHYKVLFLKPPKNPHGPYAENERLESLGKISGEVAHDINNMISVIIGSLKILRESKNLVSTEDSQILDRALFSADKSINLIDRLLTFACCQKLDPELVDINDLLEGLYEVICFTTGERIEVKMDLTEKKPFIYLDPGQLEASIINLCINSMNAIENKGSITISTQIRTLPDQEDELEIAVCDTGRGIPKNIQNRIFEPFFTSRKKGEGHGLGLSMVYGFVKQSGGHINIDSEMNQGTTVSLLFKLDSTP